MKTYCIIWFDHNHKVMATLLGYSYVGRLSSEEKIMVNQSTKNMVKLDQILLTIKSKINIQKF